MPQDIITWNFAVVDAHVHGEASEHVERALPLCTDDIVWESPARGIAPHGRHAAGENYRHMQGSMADLRFTPLRRFATEDRRLIPIFEMRDRKIARDIASEVWRDGAASVARVAPGPPAATAPTPERPLQPGLGVRSSKALLSARRASAAGGGSAGQGGRSCW